MTGPCGSPQTHILSIFKGISHDIITAELLFLLNVVFTIGSVLRGLRVSSLPRKPDLKNISQVFLEVTRSKNPGMPVTDSVTKRWEKTDPTETNKQNQKRNKIFQVNCRLEETMGRGQCLDGVVVFLSALSNHQPGFLDPCRDGRWNELYMRVFEQPRAMTISFTFSF